MTTEELLSRVRQIELNTKRAAKHVFSGRYHSAFKGKGMSFSEVREYTIGDEIRTIDWNVTARYNSPHVKVFEEERELTFVLLIDFSDSLNFGSTENTKRDLAIEIAALVAYSALKNNDEVGVVFVTDHVEKYIPPKKGKSHFLRIIRELIAYEPKVQTTNLNRGLNYINRVIKKRSSIVMLSDYLTSPLDKNCLFTLQKKHEIIALKLKDPLENNLPNIGVLELFNAETGTTTWVDTRNKALNQKIQQHSAALDEELKFFLKKQNIAFASFSTDEDYIPTLTQLFANKK